jgi:hypothetical protein
MLDRLGADVVGMDTNAIADQRAALERQNREIQVRVQVDTLRTCIGLGVPTENLLAAIEVMLMDNLCQR